MLSARIELRGAELFCADTGEGGASSVRPLSQEALDKARLAFEVATAGAQYAVLQLNGAAVREEGHLVGVEPEFQDEVIVSDRAVCLEAAVHLGEIDGTLALMDLHGIPAAQRDVWTTFAGEMNEIPLAAGATAGMGLSGGDFRVLVGPDIERKQGAPQVGGTRSAN